MTPHKFRIGIEHNKVKLIIQDLIIILLSTDEL